MNKLYRGISKLEDQNNGGKLLSKGTKSKVAMRYGDTGLRYDGKFQYGSTENNAARAHQLESGMHDSCFISTTRNYEIAKKFATSDNMETGYIYVINEDKLSEYGIVAMEFPDSEYPKEKEVSLRTCDNLELPKEVIIEKVEVSPLI